MSEDTRKQAIAKLNAFGQKIGYPDKRGSTTRPLPFRVIRIWQTSYAPARFDQMRDFNKINKPS